MKYIGYTSVKISHRTGSADFTIFHLFPAKAGPGLRVHCVQGLLPRQRNQFKSQRLLLPLAFDRGFSSYWSRRTALATDAKGTMPHLLGQPGPGASLPFFLPWFYAFSPPPRRLPAYPNTSRVL